MAHRNSCQFIGHVGKDGVEVKEGTNGKWGRASLAVTKRWNKEGGEKGEKTTWIQLVFPSHLVENAAKLITQGRQIFVEGELDIRDYDSEGTKKTATEIRVEDFQLLGAKPEAA